MIEMVDLDLNMDDREMLVLSNVTRNQAGEYHCLVSNEVGTGTSETVLIDILCEFIFQNKNYIIFLVKFFC